ncbi:MAG: ABC-F family ATP-binding cassette domain-containing protein [Bacteroidota bacterium]
MLTIHNLEFHFGGRTLYDQASLQIKPGDLIGLIGANGTGKSTLLRLMVGEYLPDGGDISKSNDCTIGFLNQDLLSYESDQSILNVAMEAFERQNALNQRIQDILKKLETDYTDALVDELAKLQAEFEVLEGYSMQAKAEAILEGLGFKTEELEKPLRTFSGGWRMRVMLAKMLLQKPSLLLLDEPTNHLDLPSIEWLENYIQTYEGAVVVVSHDIEFMDRAVRTIVEVSGRQLHRYEGNYTFYKEEKALREDIQQKAFDNQQQKIKQTERFIERFRSKATKARQVQARVKQLERMDIVDEVISEEVAMNFRFTFGTQPGKILFEFKDFSKSYGEKKVLDEASALMMRGDKIALIGANGIGKSTMLRIIYGSEPIQEGQRKMGHNVEPAFYAQHQLESLGLENSILGELQQAGSDRNEKELRSLLGCFLFQGDEVFKKVRVLSGGEKSRVALAKTLLSEANFLLLDEPTNHLDIQSVRVLVHALQNYEGSYIVVSHDRHFVNQIANKVWYIEDQALKEYPGTYAEYNAWRHKREQQQNSIEEDTKSTSSKKKLKKPAPPKDDKEQKRLQKELSKIEQEIADLEQQKADLETELAKPTVFSDPYKLNEVNEKFQKVEENLNAANERWEELAEEIEG